MSKRLLSILCAATALFSAVSCDDIMEMVGDITGEDNNSITSFSITPSKLSIKAEGGEATIAFTAPDVWSVSSTQDWLSFNPSAGTSGETIVTITAQANKSGKERSADVVVESAKFRASMTVSQAPEEGEVPPGPNPPDSTTTATAKWYLIGSFQDWNVSTSLEMKEVKDGVYSIDVTFPENTEFKFLKDQDPNWTVNLGSAQWASGNVSPAIKADETISLVQENDKWFINSEKYEAVQSNVDTMINYAKSIDALDRVASLSNSASPDLLFLSFMPLSPPVFSS